MIKTFLSSIFVMGCFLMEGLWGQNQSGGLYTNINMDDLRERNFSSTADLLGYLPGMIERHAGIPGQWSALSIRGQDANRTNIELDGIPIHDPWTGYADLQWIPEAWIDSVRTYPGGHSVSPCPGGTIALKTAGTKMRRPYTRFSYFKGDHDLSSLDVSFIEPLGETLKVISGITRYQYGKQTTDRASDLNTLRAKLLFQPRNGWKITYTVLSNRHEIDLPFQSFLPGVGTECSSLRRSSKRTDHAVQITGTVLNLINEWMFHVAILDHDYRLENESRHFPIRIMDAQITQRSGRLSIPLSWGLRFSQNEMKTQETGHVRQSTATGFIQGDMLLKNGLSVSPGIFYRMSDYGNHWTGSLEASYKPAPLVRVWFHAANGIRTPSLGEYTGTIHMPFPYTWNFAADGPANGQVARSLKNELNRSVETGFEWRFHKTSWIAFRGYGDWIQDAVIADFSIQPFSFSNRGEYRLLGTELQMGWKPFAGLRTNLVLNTLDSQDKQKRALLYNPTLWGNASITGEHPLFQGDLRLMLCIGIRFSNAFWTQDEGGSTVLIPAWSLLDLKITAVVMQHARLFISMDNVAGSRAYLLDGFAYPAKAVHTGLVWELAN